MASGLLLLFATTGCGSVSPPDPVDGGLDAGPPPSCTDYCSEATKCGWEEEASCCFNCRCILSHLYREEVAAPYVRCLSDELCSGSQRRCLDEAIQGVDPTSTGASFAAACEGRRGVDCKDLDCSIGLYYSDAALDAIEPCLDADTCEAVLMCIGTDSVAACSAGESCS
jgi:hypothetical protein